MSTALSFPELRSAREGAAALPSSSAQDNVSMTAQYPDIQAPEPVQSGDWSEVMLNYEIISKESLKGIVVALNVFLVLGLASLLATAIVKGRLLDQDDTSWLSTAYSSMAVTLSSLFLAAAMSAFIKGLSRVRATYLQRNTWSTRRRTLAGTALLQLGLQILNLIMWLVPNVYVLYSNKAWASPLVLTSGIIRFSLLNLVFMLFLCDAHNVHPRQPALKGDAAKKTSGQLILDAPFFIHVPKALLWAGLQAVLLATLILTLREPPDLEWRPGLNTCAFGNPHTRHLISSIGALILVYNVIFLIYLIRGGVRLCQLPVSCYRTANILQKWQSKHRKWNVMGVFLTVACCWWTDAGSCGSYITIWLGLLPLQTILTASLIGNAIFFMPVTAARAALRVQCRYQNFVWSEARWDISVEQARGRRGKEVGDPDSVFCWETAVRMLIYSAAVYEEETSSRHAEGANPVQAQGSQQLRQRLEQQHEEANGEGSCQQSILTSGMYQCQGVKVLIDKVSDIKAMIWSGGGTIVVAFRGSASMANLLTDLQAWPTRHASHPPKWNGFILRQSLAHRGFAMAWSRGTLRNSVISAIAAILQESGTTAAHMRILLTGHSLGGALSTLASYDIQKAFTFEHIQCYTFGAPYTGNHTYAREYASVVPDTWNVINDHDLVVRMGKMMCLYKRNGNRVIIDSRGSMTVQPGPLDLHVMPGHWNVKYHWLRSYRMALLEVLHYSVQQDSLIELTEMLEASPCLSNYLCTSGQNLELSSQENGEGSGQPSKKSDRDGVSRWLEVMLQESVGHLMESPLVLLARARHQTSQLDRQLFSRSKAMDGGENV